MATSSNLGGREIKFFCLNHKNPIPLQIQVGTSQFYACPKYFKENRDADERMCVNRMTLIDAGGIIDALCKKMDAIDPITEQMDFSNYIFSYRGSRSKIKVKVIKFTAKEVHLGILNETALKG